MLSLWWERCWQETTLGCLQDLQVLLAAQQWGLAVQVSPCPCKRFSKSGFPLKWF